MGDDDFYQNLLQHMNQNTQDPFLYSTPMLFSPHEAEKHTLDDDSVMDEGESKRRGMHISRNCTDSIESTNSQAMDSGSDETDNKVTKKKPGRKMMMTEPANVCYPARRV